MPAIYDRIAESSERMVEDVCEFEAQLVERMGEQAAELSPRDTAGALRNVSTAKAINIDKASVIRGRPAQITARGPPGSRYGRLSPPILKPRSRFPRA
jgi:hypothetical protein